MLIRAAILAALAAAVYGQAVAPEGGCLVCGDGQVITNPDGIFSFDGFPDTGCDVLQIAGLIGQIPLTQCPFLPGLVAADCECAPGDLPVAPTPAPVSACPAVPEGGCSVCGADLCISNPDAIFSFPGQPATPCETLELAGLTGLITPDECPFLPTLVTACECGTTGVPPTAAPIAAPTEAPVTPAPTPAPTEVPTTPAPTEVAPTPAPVSACPAVPEGTCSVCGAGLCISNKDAIFSYPDQPSTPCGTLELAGFTGLIAPAECAFLPSLVDACECGTTGVVAETAAPIAAPTEAPVTPAPTEAPTTPAPTDAPTTPAPTEAPTKAPVPAPTPYPVFVFSPAPFASVPTASDGKKGKMMGSSDDSGGMGMSMRGKKRALREEGVDAAAVGGVRRGD